RDRAVAAADLEAGGTHTDAEPFNPSLRQRVEALLEQLQATRFGLGRMRKGIVWRTAHAGILPVERAVTDGGAMRAGDPTRATGTSTSMAGTRNRYGCEGSRSRSTRVRASSFCTWGSSQGFDVWRSGPGAARSPVGSRSRSRPTGSS